MMKGNLSWFQKQGNQNPLEDELWKALRGSLSESELYFDASEFASRRSHA